MSPPRPPFFRPAWIVAGSAFGVTMIATLGAMIGTGRAVHALAMLALAGAMVFYRAHVRLSDYYEGAGAPGGRAGHRIILGCLLILLVWLVVEWFGAPESDLTTVKSLAFLCFFANVWLMFSLAAEHAREQEESEGKP